MFQFQYINTGTAANAHNGDVLQLAFTKINNNFNTLSTSSPINELVNGTYTFTLNSSGQIVLPSGSEITDLGSSVSLTTFSDISTVNTWTFNSYGNLTVPGGITSNAGSDFTISATVFSNLNYWINSFGQLSNNTTGTYASSIAYDSLGNMVVVGSTYALSSSTVGTITKYDQYGNLLWDAYITNSSGTVYPSTCEAITIDSCNNIYVLATDLVNTASIVYKFSSTATIVWQTELGNWVGSVNDIEVDSYGNTYLSGQNNLLTKIALGGGISWQVNVGSITSGTVVHVDSTGYVYAGSSNQLFKFDQLRNSIWNQTITGWSNICGITSDASNNVFIADNVGHVAQFSSTGTLNWQLQIQNLITVTSIDIDSLGNVYVGGLAKLPADPYGLSITKISNTGTLGWSNVLLAPNIIGQQQFYGHKDIAVYNGVFGVAGYSYNGTGTSTATNIAPTAIIAQLPTTGAIAGYSPFTSSTWGVFSYAINTSATTTVTSFTATAGTGTSTVVSNLVASTSTTTVILNTSSLQNYKVQITVNPIWNFSPAGITYFPNYNFPYAHGAYGQVLTDDGNGNLSWQNSGGVNFNAFSSNIIPTLDSTYNLGSPTKQWKSLYVSTNTIYIGQVPLSVNTMTNKITLGESTLSNYTIASEDYVNQLFSQDTNIDGGGSYVVYEITTAFADGGFSGNVFGPEDFTFSGTGATATNTTYTIDGGGAS